MPKISEASPRAATNATARLSVVLEMLASNTSPHPVADVLVTVLGIQKDDPNRAFLLAYTAITEMLESSQAEVETYLSDELGFYIAHFVPLRVCFNPKNSGAGWNTYRGHLSPNDVTGIRHTAQRLKTIVPEREATGEDFAEIREAIRQMQEAIDSEGLSEHSRNVLNKCLNAIKTAVDEYRFWGADGINNAYKSFIGTLFTDIDVQKCLAKSKEEKSSFWEKTIKVGTALSLLLGILHGIHDFKQDYLPTFEKLILPYFSGSGKTIDSKIE